MSYNEQLEDQIDHYFIDRRELVKNRQMGGVGWLMDGNMCCGIYEDLLVVRIDPKLRPSIIDKPGVERFGKHKNDESFISLIEAVYSHPKALHKFLSHAREYTAALPPKDQNQNLQP